MSETKDTITIALHDLTKERAGIAKDDPRLPLIMARSDSLKSVLTEFSKAEVKGSTRVELSEPEAQDVIRMMVRRSSKAADDFDAAGASDHAQAERTEAAYLGEFLPTELSKDETRVKIAEIIAENNLSGAKALGIVMKGLSAFPVDKKMASAMAREMLGA